MQKGSAVSWSATVLLTLGLAGTAVSCQNPLIDQLQQRIVEDVTIYLAGDAPRILNSSPAPSTSDIPTSAAINAVFNMVLDPATITESTVTLSRLSPAAAVPGTLSYDAATHTASFTPATRLDPDTSYRLTVSTGVKSAKGAALGTAFSTTFTTRYFHDDEIGIDLSYVSTDLTLSTSKPIYLEIFGLPLSDPVSPLDSAILDSPKITASGKYRIPQNLIPGGASQVVLALFHDINGNYVSGNAGADDGDSRYFVKPGATGNLAEATEAIDEIYASSTDGFFDVPDIYILDVGTGYTVTYTDGAGANPVVDLAMPSNGSIDRSTSTPISASFDIDLDPTTVTGSTVILTQIDPQITVDGTVSYNPDTRTVSFTPITRLSLEKTYEFRITTGVTSLKTAPLASAYTTTFTTRYFHDDEIGINLSYSSADLVLSSLKPIYFKLYAVPLRSPANPADVAVPGGLKISSPGKYRISRSLIPGGGSQAVVAMFHDVNGNYVSGNTGADAGDSQRFVKIGDTGNTSDAETAYPEITAISSGGFYVIPDAFKLWTGTGYTVTYSDGAGPAPVVLDVSPTSASTTASTSAVVSASFDIDLDPATVTTGTVSLSQSISGAAVSGTVSYNLATRTLSFTPGARLDLEKSYRLLITTGVRSVKSAPLAANYTTTFTTRYFHDDEIGINLSYSSADLVLNSDAPIYIQLYTVPLPYPADFGTDMAILSTMPITANGKYRIPKTLIPRQSSQALVFLFHDIDGNYVPGADGAGDGDSERIIKIGAPGNVTDPDGASIILGNSGGFYIVDPSAILETGNGYIVSYSDSSPYSADGFETLDTSPSSARILTQGIVETARNLHSLGDVDYLRFIPATTDRYALEVGGTGYQLRVELYPSDSAALTRTGALAGSTGSEARNISAGMNPLIGGQTYYLRVDSPDSGLGNYEISYQFATASADTAEPDNDIASATALPLGRSNIQTHTFHEDSSGDYDWFALELESGKTYVVEVEEDPSYFGYGAQSRGLKADFRLEWSDGSSTGIYYPLVVGGNTLFIDDPDRWWGGSGWPAGSNGSGTFYLKVGNNTALVGNQRPTMQYTILFTWGPDSADSIDNPYMAGNQFDQFNEHGPAGITVDGTAIRYAVQGDQGTRRTIYSVLPSENPQDDVDWFRIQSRNNLNDYLIWTTPEPGTEGIIVEFEVYKAKLVGEYDLIPDLAAGPRASGQQWSGSQNEPVRGVKIYPGALSSAYTYYPTPIQSTFFVKVLRSTAPTTNPLTGAYRLFFKAGADNEDNQIPDTYTTVGGIQYRLDETPWIGQPNSTDFSTRNKLADRNDWSSGITPMRFNSIYARNYDHSTGKPLAGVDPYPDHDYLWVEIPTGKTSVALSIIASFENQAGPGMPIRATVRKAPNINAATALLTIQARDSNANKVVTEGELVYVGAYTSNSYFQTNGDHQIYQNIAVTGGDVLFIRVERDNVNAGVGDPQTAEYSIRFF